MHLIIVPILAVALLYFWLVGSWFARILTFLLLIPVITLAIMAAIHDPPLSLLHVLIAVVAGVAAWFVSGLPEYYWRRRTRLFTGAANLAR